MAADETIRLRIMAESVGVDQAQASMARLHKAIETYVVQTEVANSAAIKFARSINITTQMAAADAAARQSSTAAHIKLTESMLAADKAARSGAGGMQNFGRSVLFVSQGVEDLQYGFSAVVNNIPMLVMAMGGSMGLAGTVSLVAVGVNLLARHWDELASIFGKGHVKTQAEEMEELGKQTAKTAEEMKRYLDYKEREKGAEKIIGGKPEKETKSTEAVAKSLAELPFEDKRVIAQKLSKQHESDFGLGFTEEERRQLTHARQLQTGVTEEGSNVATFGENIKATSRVGTGNLGLGETNEQAGARMEQEILAKKRAELEQNALNDLEISGKNEHAFNAAMARLRKAGLNAEANRLEGARRAATRQFDEADHPGQTREQYAEMQKADIAAELERKRNNTRVAIEARENNQTPEQYLAMKAAETAADKSQKSENLERLQQEHSERAAINKANAQADITQATEHLNKAGQDPRKMAAGLQGRATAYNDGPQAIEAMIREANPDIDMMPGAKDLVAKEVENLQKAIKEAVRQRQRETGQTYANAAADITREQHNALRRADEATLQGQTRLSMEGSLAGFAETGFVHGTGRNQMMTQSTSQQDLGMRMIQARQMGMMRQFRTASGRREWAGMSAEEQQKRISEQNDIDDKQAMKFQASRLMAAGITKDNWTAERIAKAQVMENRAAMNGMTNDPTTQEQIKNTDAVNGLTEVLKRGVNLQLAHT